MVNHFFCCTYVNDQANFKCKQISFTVMLFGTGKKNVDNCREKNYVYTFVDIRV